MDSVWNVYDELRTARMNVKYYGCKLVNAGRLNTGVTLTIALASSSSVGGLWLFQGLLGGWIWKILGTVTAFLAVYQSVVKPAEKIQKLEKHYTGCQGLAFDLERLSRRIGEKGAFTPELRTQFELMMDRKGELLLTYPDPATSDRLLDRCAQEVNRELPSEGFFVPEETHERPKEGSAASTEATP